VPWNWEGANRQLRRTAFLKAPIGSKAVKLSTRVKKLEDVIHVPRVIVVTYPDNLDMAEDEIRRQATEQWRRENPGNDATEVSAWLVQLVGPPRDASPRWSLLR